MSLDLEIDRYCFVCGVENPEGLKVKFHAADGKAAARWTARPEHQGYAGVSHGGILAALLDEAMVYAATSLGRWTATAELTIRYHQPAPTESTFDITSEVTAHRRRIVECSAWIRGTDGRLLASATGKLMQGREIRPEEGARIGVER
jgi:uncharacterized protein (TIGR00369 family)